MSMWEFEAVAEEIVVMVGKSDWPLAEKRNAYGAAYRMTNWFDVGFTHFRQVKLLQEAEHFIPLKVEDHPEYAAREDEFKALIAEGRTGWIRSADDRTEAFFRPKDNAFWFDPDMVLWQKAKDAGILTGLAAEEIVRPDFLVMIAKLMKLANDMGETQDDALKMLHGFVCYLDHIEKEAGDARLAPALELPRLADALQSRPGARDEWIDQRFDGRTFLKDSDWMGEDKLAFYKWWCAPYGNE